MEEEQQQQQQTSAREGAISRASSPNDEEEDDPARPPTPGPLPENYPAAGPPLPRPELRRKTSSVRPWMTVTESGQSRVERVGRCPMMRRTGLPARDLRALDAASGHLVGILPRRRAVVVHLEHARAVITATEVWVPDPGDPLVAPFARELQTRIAHSRAAVVSPEADKSGLHGKKHASRGEGEPGEALSLGSARDLPAAAEISSSDLGKKINRSKRVTGTSEAGSSPVLTFEFRALEVCLESVCRRLEFESLALEKEAHLAMDGLNSKISTHKLERVRQIKGRLLDVSGRTRKVRDELERILDNDSDMVEMHLTEKLIHERKNNLSPKKELANDELYSCGDGIEGGSQESETDILPRNPSGRKQNVQELEKLLEAYFVQTEGILTKLSITRELVDDAINYANILLDDRQNQLLHMGVVMSTAAIFIAAAVVVTNHLGFSLRITLFNRGTEKQFWEAAIGLTASTIVLYLVTIGWFKRIGILV